VVVVGRDFPWLPHKHEMLVQTASSSSSAAAASIALRYVLRNNDGFKFDIS